MCKRKAGIAIFAVVFLFCCVFLPVSVSAASSALSLDVSYTAKCGSPTTFTATASGGSGNYMYYLGNITRNGEDGWYFVVDPSTILKDKFKNDFGYKTDNKFQFTFFASGRYRLDFYVLDKGVTPAVTVRKVIYVTINDPAHPSIEAIADGIAKECKQKCNTEYERALWLHDWLLAHCSYDHDYLYCGAAGALVRGKGTCETYHRAYTMLLNRVGIKNGRMEGNGHVWTAVRMDGSWYQVDVTWDDNGYSKGTYENYLYFGLNDTIMKLVHSDHSPHQGYESNALANNYLIRSGEIRRWSDPLAETVQQRLDAGQTSFTLSISSSLPVGYNNVLYSVAAYQLSEQSWSVGGKPMQLSASYSDKQMKFSAVPAPPPVSSSAAPAAPATSSQANGVGGNQTASQGTTVNTSSPSGTARPSIGGSPSGTVSGTNTGQYTSTPNIAGALPSSGSVPNSAVSSEPPVILPPVEEHPILLTDKGTGVKLGAAEGVIPPDTALVVEPSDFVLTEAVGKFASFDISLESGGVKIQPNGKVQVSLPIPAGYDRTRLTIYYIADGSIKTELPCAVMGDTVTFEAEHFSIYALAEKPVIQEGAGKSPAVDREPGAPNQKNGRLMLWLVAGIVLAAAAAGGFALWWLKRRKESKYGA